MAKWVEGAIFIAIVFLLWLFKSGYNARIIALVAVVGLMAFYKMSSKRR